MILPARVQSEKAKVNEDLRAVSEQSDAKSATIDDLSQQINTLTTQNTQLQEQLEAYVGANGTMSIMDELLQAVQQRLPNSVFPDNLINVIDETLASAVFDGRYAVDMAQFQQVLDRLAENAPK